MTAGSQRREYLVLIQYVSVFRGDGSQFLWVIQYSLPSMHRCTDVLCVCLVNLGVHVCNLSYVRSLLMPA